jgi:hypothetical protein
MRFLVIPFLHRIQITAGGAAYYYDQDRIPRPNSHEYGARLGARRGPGTPGRVSAGPRVSEIAQRGRNAAVRNPRQPGKRGPHDVRYGRDKLIAEVP